MDLGDSVCVGVCTQESPADLQSFHLNSVQGKAWGAVAVQLWCTHHCVQVLSLPCISKLRTGS